MNLSNAFLAQCAALKHAGFEAELEIGAVVARGFADLGFEAFSVLPGDKLLSLFTGKISSMTVDERQHLFFVPDADQLIQFIQRKCGFEVDCETPDGRTWNITLGPNKLTFDSRSSSLVEALIEITIQLLSSPANA